MLSGCGGGGDVPDGGSVKVQTLDPPTNATTAPTSDTGATDATGSTDAVGPTSSTGPTGTPYDPNKTKSGVGIDDTVKAPKKKAKAKARPKAKPKTPDYKVVKVPEPKKKTPAPVVVPKPKPNYDKIARAALSEAYDSLKRAQMADSYDRFPTGDLAVRTIKKFADKVKNVSKTSRETCSKGNLGSASTVYVMGDTSRASVHLAYRTPDNKLYELVGDGDPSVPAGC